VDKFNLEIHYVISNKKPAIRKLIAGSPALYVEPILEILTEVQNELTCTYGIQPDSIYNVCPRLEPS